MTPDRALPYGDFDENWWLDETQRYRALGRTFYWAFVPHSRNAATRKIVTTILMGTWSVMTIGKAFGMADTGGTYPYISTLVFAIVCTIWGFEIGMLDAVAKSEMQQSDVNQIEDKSED